MFQSMLLFAASIRFCGMPVDLAASESQTDNAGSTLGYLGCGKVTTFVACDGCMNQGSSINCECFEGTCRQDNNECTQYNSAYVICHNPPQLLGKLIVSAERCCQRRLGCLNSMGQEAGPCTMTCTSTESWVEFGASRTVYFVTSVCECPPAP